MGYECNEPKTPVLTPPRANKAQSGGYAGKRDPSSSPLVPARPRHG